MRRFRTFQDISRAKRYIPAILDRGIISVSIRVETLKQLSERVGISHRQARHLVQIGQLDHVMIGCRIHVPEGAWERFIAEGVQKCRAGTKALVLLSENDGLILA